MITRGSPDAMSVAMVGGGLKKICVAFFFSDLASYPWSSYRVHGMGQPDPLISPLPGYVNLRNAAAARLAYWREWVHTPLTERELAAIRRAVVSGRPFGSAEWQNRMSLQQGIPLTARPRGRPRKLGVK